MIKAAIDGLVESATNLVTNITAILPNVLNGIAQFITAMLEMLPTLIQQLLPTFVNIIIMAADTVITTLPAVRPGCPADRRTSSRHSKRSPDPYTKDI